MSNPASVKRQVIGVFDAERARQIGEALMEAGTERVVTLHSKDGLDEVSSADETFIWELRREGNGTIQRSTGVLHPELFGYPRRSLDEMKGGDAAANAKILLDVLNGEMGPPGRRWSSTPPWDSTWRGDATPSPTAGPWPRNPLIPVPPSRFWNG